jgi:hypothetical protein
MRHATLVFTTLTCSCLVPGILADDKEDKKPPENAIPGQLPTVLHYDFRTEPIPEELTSVNVESARLFQIEPEGLHIQLPKEVPPTRDVGVWTKSGLKGDFDITAACRINRADVPDGGYGVGVILKVEKENTVAGLVGRLMKPGDNDIVM